MPNTYNFTDKEDEALLGHDPHPVTYAVKSWLSDFSNVFIVAPFAAFVAFLCVGCAEDVKYVGNIRKIHMEVPFISAIMIAIGCSLLLFCLFARFINNLSMYGISQNSTVWTVNFKMNTVLRLKILNVDHASKTFADTQFLCVFDDNKETLLQGIEVVLQGADLFRTNASAEEVLKYINSVNSKELSKYCPDWETDSDFTDFLDSRISGEPGFCLNEGNQTAFVLAPVCIRGINIHPRPVASPEYLFKKFLDAMDQKKKEADEELALIARVNEYRKGAAIDKNS